MDEIKNTLENKKLFESSSDFKIKAAPHHQANQNLDEVFFIVNVKELFNIDLNYPGIIGALNKAFAVSREFTPYDSGVTYRSYSMVKLDNERVKVFYDPAKVIGANRYGRTVKEYYPAFIAQHASRFNWLSIVIKHFYDELFSQVELLKKKADNPDNEDDPRFRGLSLVVALLFMKELRESYNRKKEEAKALRDQERKQKEERKKIYRELKRKAKESKKKQKYINTEDE